MDISCTTLVSDRFVTGSMIHERPCRRALCIVTKGFALVGAGCLQSHLDGALV